MRSHRGDRRCAETPLIRDWCAGGGSQGEARVDVSEVQIRKWLRQVLARKECLAPSFRPHFQ